MRRRAFDRTDARTDADGRRGVRQSGLPANWNGGRGQTARLARTFAVLRTAGGRRIAIIGCSVGWRRWRPAVCGSQPDCRRPAPDSAVRAVEKQIQQLVGGRRICGRGSAAQWAGRVGDRFPTVARAWRWREHCYATRPALDCGSRFQHRWDWQPHWPRGATRQSPRAIRRRKFVASARERCRSALLPVAGQNRWARGGQRR